jgi:hypothetical protein
MNTLLLIMSICCFLSNLFFLVANITKTNIIMTFLIKIVGIVGVLTPVLYWFKLLNIIQ